MALSGDHIKDTLDATRARLLLIVLARDYETIYYRQIGQLPEAMWEGWRKEMLLVFTTPGGRDSVEAWSSDLLSEHFAGFLRAEVAKLKGSSMEQFRLKWNEAGRQRRGDQS